ncbi:hypothetical protein ES703_72328 [subsurface metagenome]
MSVAIAPDTIGQLFQPFNTVAHHLGTVKPAQTVRDLCRPRFPNGMVMRPDARHHLFVSQFRQFPFKSALV